MNLLLEFCSMLMNTKNDDEKIELHVVTWNEPDEMINESTENFDEITETVFDMGIKLTYEFNPNTHDRFIQSDKLNQAFSSPYIIPLEGLIADGIINFDNFTENEKNNA